jgi:hypothetical protein
MANAAWPGNLPAYVNEGGYSEALPDQALESEMDSGPPRVRRRFSTNWRPFGFQMSMTAAQKLAFETFYNDTLFGGTMPFDWVHPIHRTAATFRFRKPTPKVVAVQGEKVIMAFALDQIA